MKRDDNAAEKKEMLFQPHFETAVRRECATKEGREKRRSIEGEKYTINMKRKLLEIPTELKMMTRLLEVRVR